MLYILEFSSTTTSASNSTSGSAVANQDIAIQQQQTSIEEDVYLSDLHGI